MPIPSPDHCCISCSDGVISILPDLYGAYSPYPFSLYLTTAQMIKHVKIRNMTNVMILTSRLYTLVNTKITGNLLILQFNSCSVNNCGACDLYTDFFCRLEKLLSKLLNQEYIHPLLISSLLSFYGRHHKLIGRYKVEISNETIYHRSTGLITHRLWHFPYFT